MTSRLQRRFSAGMGLCACVVAVVAVLLVATPNASVALRLSRAPALSEASTAAPAATAATAPATSPAAAGPTATPRQAPRPAVGEESTEQSESTTRSVKSVASESTESSETSEESTESTTESSERSEVSVNLADTDVRLAEETLKARETEATAKAIAKDQQKKKIAAAKELADTDAITKAMTSEQSKKRAKEEVHKQADSIRENAAKRAAKIIRDAQVASGAVETHAAEEKDPVTVFENLPKQAELLGSGEMLQDNSPNSN